MKKFSKRQIRIGIDNARIYFWKILYRRRLTNKTFRYYMKYCNFMKRDPVEFFENLIKKILQDREEHPELYDY